MLINQTNQKQNDNGQNAASASHSSSSTSLKLLSRRSHPLSSYNFLSYFLYLFYGPLYFAGPTITFNCFQAQFNSPHPVFTRSNLIYLGRILLCFLLLEWILTYFPLFAAFHYQFYFQLSLFSQCFGIYLILIILWLKFLIIWRFFRFWSLCQGIEPPENMGSCVMNHPSIAAFWRSWHASFNQWLVRYIYIPLGGSDPNLPIWRRSLNVITVFGFVAFWHERNAQLMFWGLGMAVGILYEKLGDFISTHSGYTKWTEHTPHRALAGISLAFIGNFRLLLMMAINFIGYSAGTQGIQRIIGRISGWNDWKVVFIFQFVLTLHCIVELYLDATQNMKRLSKSINGKEDRNQTLRSQ